MVNPFQVPGTTHEWEPLRPWRFAGHREYYLDIGGFRTAQESFLDRVNPVEQLSEKGRLVLVSGETGFGKTSMIHHCADTLRELAGGSPKRAPVVDLTEHVYTESARGEATSRRLEVCREVLLALRDQDILSEDEEVWSMLPPPGESAGAAEMIRLVYRRLATVAAYGDHLLVVLLPPVQSLRGDLDEYAFLARQRGRIVFFAESTELGSVEDSPDRQRLQQELQREWPELVSLRVDAIDVDDACALASHRLSRPDLGQVATVADEEIRQAMEEVARWMSPIAVSKLHTALYRVWRDYEGVTPPPTITRIDIVNKLGRDDHFRGRA